jgi:protein dpy-30
MSGKEELDPNVNSSKVSDKNAENKSENNNNNKENTNNLPIRAYLDKTVVPLVLQGMAEVAKERPDNPVKYLADFLMNHSTDAK